MLGIRGGVIDLKIVEKGKLSFDETLENPRRGIYLSFSGFLLNLSFTLDRLVKMKERCGDGIVFGIRVRQLFSPPMSNWKIYEKETADGPGVSFQGPYIVLLFGGGGMCSRKEETARLTERFS